MIRRLFWVLLGLVLGVWAVRKVEEVTEAARPGTVAARTGRRVGGTQARWRDAVAAGRDAARAREAELRSRYDVPSLLDLAALDGEEPGPPPPPTRAQ